MLKLLLTFCFALALPMGGVAVAQTAAEAEAGSEQPWWVTINKGPVALGLYGFNVDESVPSMRNCEKNDLFFCLDGFTGKDEWNMTGVAYLKASATDEFLGKPVLVAVAIKERITQAVAAETGGPPEQERILAELTRRHGKPAQVWRKNVRLVPSAEPHEYLTAHWDLPEGEICFQGTQLPKKGETTPSGLGYLRYWNNKMRATWSCSRSAMSL